jgi:hypothetical protein
MSLVYMALLPKLSISRHTERSIVHGPYELGGMALPELYIIQNIDKVQLLLGHLRLRDRTDILLQLDLNDLQLLSGTHTCIMNKDFKDYQSWLGPGWLTSVWEFLSSMSFTLQIPYIFPTFTPQENVDGLFSNEEITRKGYECLEPLQTLFTSH